SGTPLVTGRQRDRRAGPEQSRRDGGDSRTERAGGLVVPRGAGSAAFVNRSTRPVDHRKESRTRGFHPMSSQLRAIVRGGWMMAALVGLTCLAFDMIAGAAGPQAAATPATASSADWKTLQDKSEMLFRAGDIDGAIAAATAAVDAGRSALERGESI